MSSDNQNFFLNHLLHTALLIAVFIVLTACDKPIAQSYTIPKEKVFETTPSEPDKSQMQVLPGMQSFSESASAITYTVPENWTEFPAASIRKANFQVENRSGKAEVSITVFPGDVGGMLANINRWREQVQLEPIEEGALSEIIIPIIISQHQGYYTLLQGNTQSIQGGILPFHGSTWFIKMQGDILAVEDEVNHFKSFLSSLRIEDNHH